MVLEVMPRPSAVSRTRGDLKQRESLGDHRARLAHGGRHLLLRVAVALGKSPVAVRLLERGQVLALEVLDQGDLESFLLGGVHLDDGHLVETRLDRGAVPALPEMMR